MNLLDLPEDEARLMVYQEMLEHEEQYLEWMIQSNKDDDVFIQDCIARARSINADYEMLGVVPGITDVLKQAVMYAEWAQLTRDSKFTIGEIREQRKRVAWEKNRLQQIQQNGWRKPSSPDSTSSHLKH